MEYLFSAIGGSGSTFLINSLIDNGYAVLGRPDHYFVPELFYTGKGLPVLGNDQIIHDYNVPISENTKTAFYGMLNEPVPEYELTVGEAMLNHIMFVQAQDNATTVFNYLSIGRFFSTYGVRNIVHLIRHPLHCYTSLAGRQHPHLSEHFGGLNSEGAVRWFAEIWNQITDEYLTCVKLGLNHFVVRYEFIKEDIKALPFPPTMFSKFKGSKKRTDLLCDKMEKLLLFLVWDNFFALYPSWGNK